MNFLHCFLIRLFVILFFSAAVAVLPAAQSDAAITPDQLRQRIEKSVGPLPRNPEYRLDGRFNLAASWEDVSYRVRVVQASGKIADRRAVAFTHENRTRDLRFFLSGETAWAASPEITVDVMAEQIPYLARFDFHVLYAELLDILAQGSRSPEFRIERSDNEIYVHGRLKNGWNAVFTLNLTEAYPRKVKISTGGERTAAWMVPYVSPGDVWRPQIFPEWTTEFEIWIYVPAQGVGGDYRYARRIDFVERDMVVGSFFSDENWFITGNTTTTEEIFTRPPVFPWIEGARFKPDVDDRDGIYGDDSLRALRSRLNESPWSQWERRSLTLAFFSVVVSVFSRLLPYYLPPKILAWIIGSGYLILLFLLLKFSRPTRFGTPPVLHKFPRKTAIAGFFVGFIMFIAGASTWMTHLPTERSRIALHLAIRFAVTERGIYATGADLLLENLSHTSPVETWEELGRSSQNCAIAYDLIRKNLSPQRRAEIEADLFEYAKPLMGVASGWRANEAGAAVIASGLGLTGLALNFEPFVASAESVIERYLSGQLSGGVHRAGPGRGSADMDVAANLFYGFRRAGRTDYYEDARFREYVSTTLKSLSPAGTLPLFGGTNLDDSLGFSLFVLKIADKMPEETGRQCVAAHNLYMEYGILNSEGWSRRIASRLLPFLAYYENPHVLLQYETALAPSELPRESFAAGDGQLATLRAGSGEDAIYLALNMLRSGSRETSGDALSFDLFAKSSLMLNGSVFPPKGAELMDTVAGNTPTFSNDAQTMNTSAGITSMLLNQPVFDSARALADKAYMYGYIKRDFIMARPEENMPGYFVVMDDISEIDFDTTVKWRLHGRGETAIGLDQRIRWNSTVFGRPRLRSIRSALEVMYPVGIQGRFSASPGILRSRFPFFNQRAQSVQVEWIGGGRFCSILAPHGEKEQPPVIEAQGEYVCRIGNTDWFSFGDLTRRIASDSFEHVSEYSLVRSRGEAFPALTMGFGVECRFGDHSIISDKSISVSLDGLGGDIQNYRPETNVMIQSTEISEGARFLIGDRLITAEKPGVLVFILSEPGTHSLRRQQGSAD